MGVNNLPRVVVAQQRPVAGIEPALPLDRKSDALPLRHPSTTMTGDGAVALTVALAGGLDTVRRAR